MIHFAFKIKIFNYAIRREGKYYVSRCLNNDIASLSESREEALANLKEALELYFEDSYISEIVLVP